MKLKIKNKILSALLLTSVFACKGTDTDEKVNNINESTGNTAENITGKTTNLRKKTEQQTPDRQHGLTRQGTKDDELRALQESDENDASSTKNSNYANNHPPGPPEKVKKKVLRELKRITNTPRLANVSKRLAETSLSYKKLILKKKTKTKFLKKTVYYETSLQNIDPAIKTILTGENGKNEANIKKFAEEVDKIKLYSKAGNYEEAVAAAQAIVKTCHAVLDSLCNKKHLTVADCRDINKQAEQEGKILVTTAGDVHYTELIGSLISVFFEVTNALEKGAMPPVPYLNQILGLPN